MVYDREFALHIRIVEYKPNNELFNSRELNSWNDVIIFSNNMTSIEFMKLLSGRIQRHKKLSSQPLILFDCTDKKSLLEAAAAPLQASMSGAVRYKLSDYSWEKDWYNVDSGNYRAASWPLKNGVSR